MASGTVDNSDARSLLGSVNYEAEVTWNEATVTPKRDNIGNLIVGIFGLIGILLLVMLIFGIFFGGFRFVANRFFPDRVFKRSGDLDIIQLHLRD